MASYAIVEVDQGLMVVEIETGATPEETAIRHGGILIDAGPFPCYEDAVDAMMALEDGDDEESE